MTVTAPSGSTGRGSEVVSLLMTFHSKSANRVRLVRIDPRTGRLVTWVASPNGKGDFRRYTRTIRGLTLVDWARVPHRLQAPGRHQGPTGEGGRSGPGELASVCEPVVDPVSRVCLSQRRVPGVVTR